MAQQSDTISQSNNNTKESQHHILFLAVGSNPTLSLSSPTPFSNIFIYIYVLYRSLKRVRGVKFVLSLWNIFDDCDGEAALEHLRTLVIRSQQLHPECISRGLCVCPRITPPTDMVAKDPMQSSEQHGGRPLRSTISNNIHPIDSS